MRWISIGAALLAVIATAAQAQQLTVEETIATKERASSGGFAGRAEWNALGYYFQGVIEGAAGYQQSLLSQGKLPLFCPPANRSYSVEEIFQFLEESAATEKSKPATLVILGSYARTFPCEN